MDILDFTDKFNRIEIDNNFFSLKDSTGLLYWDIVRHDVFYAIYYNICDTVVSTTFQKKNFSGKLLTMLKDVVGLLQFFFKINKKYDYVFFVATRNKTANGSNIDFIAKDTLLQLKGSVLVIDTFSKGKMSTFFNSVFNYGLIVERYKSKFFNKNRYVVEPYQANNILNESFNISIDLNSLIKTLIVDFKVSNNYYKKLFLKTCPKAVFFVQNGIQKGLINAANNLSITTVELQHGLIGYIHPAYSYPIEIKIQDVGLLPKFFLSFSDFWTKEINFPIQEFIPIGNQFYSQKVTKKQCKFKILFISANIYINDILEIVEELYRNNYNEEICIKLHPNQFNEFESICDKVKLNKKITVISNQESIQNLLSVSESVFAIQSTVVYEALHNNLKVYIYKIKDYKTHNDVFEYKNVYLIENSKDIITYDKIKVSLNLDYNIFNDFNKDKLQTFIEKINYRPLSKK